VSCGASHVSVVKVTRCGARTFEENMTDWNLKVLQGPRGLGKL
jgi:hypothetical protein